MTKRPILFAFAALFGVFIACSDDETSERVVKGDAAVDAKGDRSTEGTDSATEDAGEDEETDSATPVKDTGPDVQGCVTGKCQSKAECCLAKTTAGTSKDCTGATPVFCCIPTNSKTTGGGGACCSGNAKYNGSELLCSP